MVEYCPEAVFSLEEDTDFLIIDDLDEPIHDTSNTEVASTPAPVMQEESNHAYRQFMHDSCTRRAAFEGIFKRMESMSKRNFSTAAKNAIADVLLWKELEKGVSVFLAKEPPSDKELLAMVFLGSEKLELYFGKNRSRGNTKYALGIRFRFLSSSERAEYDDISLNREYPGIAKALIHSAGIRPNEDYLMHVYPKAKDFVEALKGLQNPEWLCQKPDEKGNFVPSRPIGAICGNAIYISDPMSMARSIYKYERRCRFNFAA